MKSSTPSPLPISSGGTGATTAAAAAAALVSAQTISGNTVLTTQRDLLTVTAAAQITLPAISTWTIGKTTRVVYRGTSAVTIELIANAADKIEGSGRVALNGIDIIAEFTPIAANKVVVDILRGEMAWVHASVDLTAATGASPWTLNTNNSDATTWTDVSSASNSLAVATGLQHTSTAVSYFGSGLGSIVSCPLAAWLDAWDRPWKPTDKIWLLSNDERTAGSSANVDVNTTVSGSSAALPRMGITNDRTLGLRYVFNAGGTNVAQTLAASRMTASGWSGFLIDPDARMFKDAILSTSPSGAPGTDWWPWTYSGNNGIAVGQGDHTAQDPWPISGIVSVNLVQTGATATSGEKYTRKGVYILQLRTGSR